jgi:Mrp family chromosome partitioning ATPase
MSDEEESDEGRRHHLRPLSELRGEGEAMTQTEKPQDPRSAARRALLGLRHPKLEKHNVVELGMIPNVGVEGQRVIVTLALPVRQATVRAQLEAMVRGCASEACPGWAVEVEVRAMTPEERATFTACAEGRAPSFGDQPAVRSVVAVMSGKGGVGKSSVAGLLACALRRAGLRVGILDADITGPSIPKLFGVHDRPGEDPRGIRPPQTPTGIKLMSINLLLPDEDRPVIWRGPLIGRAIQQFWNDIAWGDLDVLVVDLPPGTSDAALTVMQSLPVHGVVLVTSPQDLAGMVVRKAAHMAEQMGVRLYGLVENMSHLRCPQCGCRIEVFGASRAERIVEQCGVPMLGHLPLDPDLAAKCDEGKIEDYESESFEVITERVMEATGRSESAGKQAAAVPVAAR